MSRTHIPQFTVELLLQAVCTFLAPHYQCYVSLCPSAAASSAAAACPCDASKLVRDDVTHMALSTDTTPTHSGFSNLHPRNLLCDVRHHALKTDVIQTRKAPQGGTSQYLCTPQSVE